MVWFHHRRVGLTPWTGPGRIVTIWGPTGSPGRSTLAAGLAGALAPAGRVILVDADRSRGALGPLLGVTGGGNIVGAATAPPPPDAPCRPRDLHAHPAGFTLIRGVPGPAQETTLEPRDLAALLSRLRDHWDLVIVDVGAALPPRECGAMHLAALRVADLVLVVGALTPLGLSDLLLQIRMLAERLDPAGLSRADSATRDGSPDCSGPPAWCVLNRGRGSLLRHGPGRVTAETGLPVAVTLPLDTRNVVAAEDAHLPLTVARPHSPAATLIAGLAARVWRVPPHQPLVAEDGRSTTPGTSVMRRISGDVPEAPRPAGRRSGDFPEMWGR